MNNRPGYSASDLVDMEYHTVGGLLLFFCFAMVVVGPLYAGWSIWRDLDSAPLSADPALAIALRLFLYGVQTILALLGAVVGVLLWRVHRHGVRLAKIYLLLQFMTVLFVTAGLVGLGALGGEASEVWDAAWPDLLRSAFVGGVWWIYLDRSHRVKRTYELKYRTESEGSIGA